MKLSFNKKFLTKRDHLLWSDRFKKNVYERGVLKNILSLMSLFILAVSCSEGLAPRATGVLEHYAYVWNRKATVSLEQEILKSSEYLKGYSVLGGEVSWSSKGPMYYRAEMPGHVDKIKSVSLRVNSLPEGVAGTREYIIEKAVSLVSQFTVAGYEVEELQLDYELEKITDINQITAFGVMMTPALAVDGMVKLVGTSSSVDKLKQIFS